ncbi:MAG: hypothetical protein AB1641_09780 [Thermodesulfobacteriota bacterium]
MVTKRSGSQRAFAFEDRLERYQAARADVLESCRDQAPPRQFESMAEACAEIALAVKRVIRRSGLSRDQVLDRINAYFGMRLSSHMFNHYLSKPAQYPLPAYLLYPLMQIASSLEIAQALVEPLGARVISREEVRLMALGKLDQMVSEMQRLKREIKDVRS